MVIQLRQRPKQQAASEDHLDHPDLVQRRGLQMNSMHELETWVVTIAMKTVVNQIDWAMMMIAAEMRSSE